MAKVSEWIEALNLSYPIQKIMVLTGVQNIIRNLFFKSFTCDSS